MLKMVLLLVWLETLPKKIHTQRNVIWYRLSLITEHRKILRLFSRNIKQYLQHWCTPWLQCQGHHFPLPIPLHVFDHHDTLTNCWPPLLLLLGLNKKTKLSLCHWRRLESEVLYVNVCFDDGYCTSNFKQGSDVCECYCSLNCSAKICCYCSLYCSTYNCYALKENLMPRLVWYNGAHLSTNN